MGPSRCTTLPPPPAPPFLSVDYWPTNGNLYFAAGVTNLTFAVPIINNTNIQPQDRIVGLSLAYLSSGSYGLTNASLVIINDNYPIGYRQLHSAQLLDQ